MASCIKYAHSYTLRSKLKKRITIILSATINLAEAFVKFKNILDYSKEDGNHDEIK